MKTITGLNDRLEHFEDVDANAALTLPTVRLALMRQVATANPRPEKPEEAITLYELGSTIKRAPLASLKLEDADFEMLAAAVRANKAGFVAHYQGQLLLKLREWEKPAK